MKHTEDANAQAVSRKIRAQQEQITRLHGRVAELEQLLKSYSTGECVVEQEVDINKCPNCGGEADNGHDRCYPPNPYYCTKCMKDLE